MITRRHFLTGLAAGTAAGALSGLPVHAQVTGEVTRQVTGQAPARTLAVTSRTLDINGRSASVFGLVGPHGMPGLTLDAESRFDVMLASNITEPTLIHWHGLTPPWDQDGVPGNPAAPLAPRAMRPYDFPAGPGGTHWMHAHTLQEQALLAAPLIVRTREDAARDEQEVVIMLHDFSFTPAETLLARLKGTGGGMHHGAMNQGSMNHGGMNHGSMGQMGMGRGSMDHGPMDLNDIAFDAYLANDRTLDDPEVIRVETGGRVRLRIINGAAATGFIVSTGALEGAVIAVDGQDVTPVPGHSFPISMGQRLDIRLTLPAVGGAFPILALREGERERTGVILASPGAAVAKLDPLGQAKAGVVGLGLEQALRPLSPLPARAADRTYAVTLTGTMAGYEWAISGADALRVRAGQRVEIAMANRSMMSHPMHLHGHRFQVVELNGRGVNGAVRDTVLVPPMGRVRIAFDADNPGHWPFHCDHLYHMVSGMMAFVSYEA